MNQSIVFHPNKKREDSYSTCRIQLSLVSCFSLIRLLCNEKLNRYPTESILILLFDEVLKSLPLCEAS